MQNFNITEWVGNFFEFTEEGNHEYLQDDTAVAFNLLAMQTDKAEIPKRIKDSLIFQIIKKRAEALGLRCNDYFILALATVCNNPAHAVMWVLAFRHLQDAQDVDRNDEFIYTVVKFLLVTKQKVPTDEYMSKMWTAQKNKNYKFPASDNWLDILSNEKVFIDATRKGYVDLGEKENVE